MLKIRLQRIGRRNNPSYRVIVIESTVAARKGRPVEILGTYDTIRKETNLKKDRITHWISNGAQVSDTMHNLLIKNGVLEGVKRNVLPKKSPINKEQQDDSVADTKDAPAVDVSSAAEGEPDSDKAEQTDDAAEKEVKNTSDEDQKEDVAAEGTSDESQEKKANEDTTSSEQPEKKESPSAEG